MASSQVEIAASSPFGCILRDHNRRDRRRESTAFRKNLQDLVTCINISPDSSDNEQRAEGRSLKLPGGKQEKDVVEEPPLTLSPRQLRVLDPWAAQQARDTITTVEKQSNEGELGVGSTSILSAKEEAAASPDQSEAGSSNLGASSLVQIWEARLGLSQSSNRTPTSSSSKGNSPFSCSTEEPLRKSEVGEPFEESRMSHEGSIGDWESERAIPETPPASSFSSTSSSSFQERDSDTGKSLRPPRVADIIRRLTSAVDENDNEPCTNAGVESPSLERERSVGSDHSSEQRGSTVQMTNSPRLRGRQAFNDLLMHMERDRQREIDTLVERRAVSRFSQKGRIQSLLRLKVLQRRMGFHLQLQQQQRPRSSGSAEGSGSSHSSTIVHLREKFKVTSSPTAVMTGDDVKVSTINPQTQSTNDSSVLDDSSSISGDRSTVSESHRVEEVRDAPRQNLLSEEKEPIKAEDLRNERSLTSNITHPEENFKPIIAEDHQDERSLSDVTYQEVCSEAITAEDVRDKRSLTSNVTYQETGFEVNSLELQEQPESFTSMNGCWYEEGTAEDEGEESNMEEDLVTSEYEWFLGVSRPRSFWEDQRQAWYRDVLETKSEDSDIRRLLERRRVSTFLSSDFRDRMNSLMVCHMRRQTRQMSNQEDDMSSNERMNHFLSSFLRCHSQSADHQEEEQEEQCEEEEEEEEAVQVKQAEAVVPEEGERIYLQGQQRMDQLMEEEEEQVYLRGQERMNQSAVSHLQADLEGSQEEGIEMGMEEGEYREEEEEEEDEQEAEGQVEEDEEQGDIMIEEENYEGEEPNVAMEDLEEDEEEESPINRRYHEAREYFNHSNRSSFTMRSPTYMGSWSYRSCEANSNDLQPVASTSSPEPLNSSSYHHDAWQHINSVDRLSMEMELINDLRGQMKQLYQEIAELRKSINSCMDMQAKLQDSMKDEMNPVKPQDSKVPRKGMCCICYEMQVDSLLYRCGHMCTCLKCAHELQWSSGKCPICRAPIMDVVRAYRDS